MPPVALLLPVAPLPRSFAPWPHCLPCPRCLPGFYRPTKPTLNLAPPNQAPNEASTHVGPHKTNVAAPNQAKPKACPSQASNQGALLGILGMHGVQTMSKPSPSQAQTKPNQAQTKPLLVGVLTKPTSQNQVKLSPKHAQTRPRTKALCFEFWSYTVVKPSPDQAQTKLKPSPNQAPK